MVGVQAADFLASAVGLALQKRDGSPVHVVQSRWRLFYLSGVSRWWSCRRTNPDVAVIRTGGWTTHLLNGDLSEGDKRDSKGGFAKEQRVFPFRSTIFNGKNLVCEPREAATLLRSQRLGLGRGGPQ